MGDAPRVTVLMPAYNAARFIREAIDSVLRQSFSDFELLLVDDGSSDDTLAIVQSHRDPRIRIVRHERNLGVAQARNTGVREARGAYVAMLDSDDHAHPERLAQQVAFLDHHADHAVVGSWARQVDERNRRLAPIIRPVRSRTVRARLLLAACFSNTTVMGRRSVLLEYPYQADLRVAEDLDLWARLSRKYELANLPAFLTRYRKHPAGISKQNLALKRERKIAVAAEQLVELGLDFTREDLEVHQTLRNLRAVRPDAALLEAAEDWLKKLQAANRRLLVFPEPEFSAAIGERWALLCWRAVLAGTNGWRRFAKSSLRSAAGSAAVRGAGFLLSHNRRLVG